MSNTEYPKMLYTGDKEQYSCRAVQDADEEQQYRENGLVDYADLDEPKAEEVPPPIDPSSSVSYEQFDAVVQRLATAESEIERLKSATPEPFFPEMKYADGSGVTTNPDKYSDYTIPQLQAALDEKGVKYLARDNKETLINLLG